MSDGAIARSNRVNRHTVALCVRKFLQFGLEAALGKLPRPGKARHIPDDAIAWVLHCACQKPKELGYSYELWTYALLQRHVRKRCDESRSSEFDRTESFQTASDLDAGRDPAT